MLLFTNLSVAIIHINDAMGFHNDKENFQIRKMRGTASMFLRVLH